MSVDDFQKGEEAVAQLNAERAQQERDRLAAELAAEPAFDTATKDRVRQVVRVDRIATDRNIRPDLPEIHDLALSIRQRGLLTPPLVRRRPGSDGDFLLVAGHRRHAALVALGWETTPVDEIVDLDEDEAFEIQLLENVQRVQLEPMQAARGLRLLMKRRDGSSAAEVARSIGLSPTWVRRHLKLLELPDEVQQRVSDGDLSLTIADLLRRQTDKGSITSRQAIDLAGKVAQGDMTPAEIRATFGESGGPKAPAQVKGVFRPGDGPEPRGDDNWHDAGSTADPASREYVVPDHRPVRDVDGEAIGEDGAPASWDPSRPRVQLAGEASEGQIHAQLDRYLIRWLTEHAKAVGDAVQPPADLDDLRGPELTLHVRRCAQALLRADGPAAAAHPDAVDRVL
ncbi:ParB/RepB/Spo0J family partition protein [Patulibacter sp.]|uniref:ParB/RepB/Spo0J family partition protein n=1 Tax=Patulibacter sp. TaxID=1912859 RepID=UPI002721ACD5|nr:ParB/RepB/Spo0J family partition protein [Patulibacter sp.]MDO9409358.1 ParB/RepB/Spo0J family partition protein [Patulibacter sp.]